MAAAKLTLIGLYQWDNTIFNDMVLPSGIDKDLLVDSLMLQGGEFETLYPDPAFMKRSIKIWSSKWYRTFAEWLRGTQETWNPIYNYDRFEESQDEDHKKYGSTTTADYNVDRTANLQDKRTAALKDERTTDLEDKRTANLTDELTHNSEDKRTADLSDKTYFGNKDTTTQLTDTNTEHQVSAYDSATYVPSSKDIVKNGKSEIDHSGSVENVNTGTDTTEHTGSDTTAHTGTDIMNHTGTDTLNTTGTDTTDHTGTDKVNHKGTLSDITGQDDNTNKHTAHMYGNIGVTTSAAMLKEFYDISTWNLYEHICDVFIGELLVPVY